ncbi:MAG: hypothetical protein WA029_04335, partial [Anaerolineae bacterium]
AGGLRVPDRRADGDAGAAHRRTDARSTDGDPCTYRQRGSHRNRSGATCDTNIARFGETAI